MGGVRRSTWYLFSYLCTGLFVVLPLRGNGLIKSKRTKQKLYFATHASVDLNIVEERENTGQSTAKSAREMEIEEGVLGVT